ncbi:MAG TPA: NUDIX domain-containing protein [Candidatus Kapabacteria bacterium]|nr:NUDIX domain-containing protein [Candidatus Kapabacteria bacterium]
MPITVAVALIVRDGRVLMGERRPDKVYPLHWEFPGGKLEANETSYEALRRELHEELAIQIGHAEEWYAEIATYSNGMTYDLRYFLVRDWDGEIQNLEFNRLLWVSYEMLPTLTHLSGNQNILERIEREGIPL